MTTLPTDSASIYEALRTLVASGQSLAIVSPSNPPQGIAGFLFDVDQKQSITLASKITDHFVEDNTAVQDHIALSPETITLTGLVAEIVKAPPVVSSNSVAIRSFDSPSLLTPTLSTGETQAATTTNSAVSTANASNSLYSYYTSRLPQQPNQSRQSMVFGYFYQLWKGRMLCTVDTPFGLLTDMAIEEVTGAQEEGTKWVSNISIRFKKIRKTSTVSKVNGKLAGRWAMLNSIDSNSGRLSQTTTATGTVNSILKIK